MSGIGRIISDHRPTPSSAAEEKASKQKTDELVKELVRDAPTGEKKGPGRPRKNSADAATPRPKSKSPSGRNLPDLPQMAPKTGVQSDAQTVTAEDAARMIGNKSVVSQLMVYCKRFPQHAPPAGYNPYMYSPEQNALVIDAIKTAVGAEIEMLTAPCLISDVLTQGEQTATMWAVTNPQHPAAPVVANLQSASSALLSDRAVSLDIGLIECQLTGLMPKNPYLRLLINAVRVLARVYTTNKTATVEMVNKQKAFSEF